MHHAIRLVIMSSLALLMSCGPTNQAPTAKRKSDNWLVSGLVANQDYAGGKILALALDGTSYRSRIGDEQNFGLQLPANGTYALYFFKPVAENADDAVAAVSTKDAAAPRDEAILKFEESPDVGVRDTLRLPEIVFTHSLSLGQIDIKNGNAVPTNNPSLKLDFDNDGIVDFLDRDDQNDGLDDHSYRKSIENISICHYDDKRHGKTVFTPLADLYLHLHHGDDFGACVGKWE